jgi:hypothetical protein
MLLLNQIVSFGKLQRGDGPNKVSF